jgi:hypothetical protein
VIARRRAATVSTTVVVRVGMDDGLRVRLDGIVGMLGLLLAAFLIRPVLPDSLSALLGIVVALVTVVLMLFGVEETFGG